MSLEEACKIAVAVDNWTVGDLISYGFSDIGARVYEYTCDELRNLVYDIYVEELLEKNPE